MKHFKFCYGPETFNIKNIAIYSELYISIFMNSLLVVVFNKQCKVMAHMDLSCIDLDLEEEANFG